MLVVFLSFVILNCLSEFSSAGDNIHPENNYNQSEGTHEMSKSNQSQEEHDHSDNEAAFFAKAQTFGTFKVGNFLQKYYFPVFIPIGVMGEYSLFLFYQICIVLVLAFSGVTKKKWLKNTKTGSCTEAPAFKLRCRLF